MGSDQQITSQKPTDEVLRKIGRNLLIFQSIEYMLKIILGNSRLQGYVHELTDNKEHRAYGIQKDMLGILIQRYVNEILSDPDEEQHGPQDLSSPWLFSAFKISGDEKFYEFQCRNLELVRKERNQLVHHFLPYWQPDSREQLIVASNYLDEQREKILPAREHLKSVFETMNQIFQEQVDFFASEEFGQHFNLMMLQSSSLIQLFCNISTRINRADGWTCLAHAGKLVHEEAPDEVSKMKAKYGYGSFKKLLVVSKCFELFEDSMPSGGFRTFYRLR
ncbi:hypothetical protein SAMN05216302_104715 [Nitrosomonas aestuarii]|uniref:HTH OST-type domain-containing protein n=1 Tax=Nitrosomonas aestuarii TaxID=52441 RepID=A0A1I4G6X5_9PROT|nr:hypothetical protein [Nitrosomonas aestuarii]SFL24836.1 hypothetical protein SAMN05216302_104715 [Nitrosomonas aestuarii]